MKRTADKIWLAGCVLLAAGLLMLGGVTVRGKLAARENEMIVQKMEAVMPNRTTGAVDELRIAEMPVMQLEGADYVALLEIPSYGLRLPVAAQWDKTAVMTTPCRFYGSAYDGSLVIGGYDRSGYFDFFDRVYNDEVVKITDLTGCTYTYTVSRVERSETADGAVLLEGEWDLTLFVRDARYLEYILLRCTAK